MCEKERWILVHLGKEEKISYDFSSKKYYRYFEKDMSGDVLAWKMFRPGKYYRRLAENIIWILLLLLILIAMETGHKSLQNIPPAARRTGAIILFAVGMFLCSIVGEAFSSKSIRELKKKAKEVEEPGPGTKAEWIQECADRLKTVKKWQMFCGVPFACFLIVYLYTGLSIAQTLSLACYIFGYMLTAFARPGLLKKYLQFHSGFDAGANH